MDECADHFPGMGNDEDNEDYVCPDCKRKMGEYLSDEEIQIEADGIKSFFEKIDPAKKANLAAYLIFEILVWGTCDDFEALGVIEETKLRYREVSLQVAREEMDKEEKEEE